jgi:hypothetical protein
MGNPRLITDGAEHRTNGKNIVSHGPICPHSENCNHWHHVPGTESAACATCWQVFDRSELALIIAGAS